MYPECFWKQSSKSKSKTDGDYPNIQLKVKMDDVRALLWINYRYTFARKKTRRVQVLVIVLSTAYHILILFLELLTGLYIINRIHLIYSYLCKLVCSACEYHGYFWFVHMSLRFDNDSKFWDITEANVNTLFPVQVYICNHRSDLIL